MAKTKKTKNGATQAALLTARSAGVLMHVTSLPSPFGIGDLGPAAYRWIDALAEARQTWWQLLPLNPPDSSNSPYSAHSAFGGNPLLISPELLVRDGLLRRGDLPAAMPIRDVDFKRVRPMREGLLKIAADRLSAGGGGRDLRHAYDRFRREEADWLEDLALFLAIKESRPGEAWTQWPRPLMRREKTAIAEARRELAEGVERHRIAQFLFRRQMDALRAHAKQRGVLLMGDMPIYVSPDCVDVWASPHLFQLDAHLKPKAVAGVPPDLFSDTGQRWGNPLYDWRAMEREGFAWWIARIRASLTQADIVRIDHFRGLAGYWRIPADAPTAQTGRWVHAPGVAMLTAVREALSTDGGTMPVVAEDLGEITPDVIALRDQFGMAGMQILQFAFGGGPGNVALPHNHPRNCIVYPGNHDNDTTAGWWKKLPREQRRHVLSYAPDVGKDAAVGLMRMAMSSVADRAIITMQDVLGLGTQARMNMPGSTSPRTWSWRCDEAGMTGKGMERLAELTQTYGRTPAKRN